MTAARLATRTTRLDIRSPLTQTVCWAATSLPPARILANTPLLLKRRPAADDRAHAQLELSLYTRFAVPAPGGGTSTSQGHPRTIAVVRSDNEATTSPGCSARSSRSSARALKPARHSVLPTKREAATPLRVAAPARPPRGLDRASAAAQAFCAPTCWTPLPQLGCE